MGSKQKSGTMPKWSIEGFAPGCTHCRCAKPSEKDNIGSDDADYWYCGNCKDFVTLSCFRCRSQRSPSSSDERKEGILKGATQPTKAKSTGKPKGDAPPTKPKRKD